MKLYRQKSGVNTIAEKLGRGYMVLHGEVMWIHDIRAEREKTRNEEILDLYLEGWTEAEIGKKLKLAVSTISTILTEFKKGIDSQIEIPGPPQIGAVWLFTNCDDDYISGFPGRTNSREPSAKIAYLRKLHLGQPLELLFQRITDYETRENISISKNGMTHRVCQYVCDRYEVVNRFTTYCQQALAEYLDWEANEE